MALKIRKKRTLGPSASPRLPVGEVVHVNDANFERVVLDAEVPVLVDFWAPWCGPCRQIGPIVEELAAAYGAQARCVKVNVDECPQTAKRFSVRSIPTISVFRAGKIVDTFVGVQPKRVLEKAVDRAIAG